MADSKEKKSNKALLEELGVDITPAKKVAHSPKEERIIAGFEEIQRFVEEHGTNLNTAKIKTSLSACMLLA